MLTFQEELRRLCSSGKPCIMVERKGADWSSSFDIGGRTPLMVAVLFDNIEFALALIQHGVDLLVQDNEGLNILDIAIKMDSPLVVKALLNADLHKKISSWYKPENEILWLFGY